MALAQQVLLGSCGSTAMWGAEHCGKHANKLLGPGSGALGDKHCVLRGIAGRRKAWRIMTAARVVFVTASRIQTSAAMCC